jgi:hypothetical protein
LKRAAVVAAIFAFALVPAPALAAGSASIVMFSEPGDYIGLGGPRLYHSGNSQIEVTGNAGDLTVWQYKETYPQEWFDLQFAAPSGDILKPGIYEDAQRAPFREPGRPGIQIFGTGRGCETRGWFEVKELQVGHGGIPERLWIVFEQYCDSPRPNAALFGEVRVGVPPQSPALIMPSVVRWPASDFGHQGIDVPVTIYATAPVTFENSSVSGSDAGDFPIRTDGCAQRTLATGQTCEVWVGLGSFPPGSRTATLRLTDGTGTTYDVPLQGSSEEPLPPTDLVVDQTSGFVTASWKLPPKPSGMLTGFLEFASDPTTDADGFFTDPNTLSFQFDTDETTFDSETFDVDPFKFPPGTYYVHVSAFDPALCDPAGASCFDLFSAPPVMLVVPEDPISPPDATSPPPSATTATSGASLPVATADRITAFAALKVASRQKAHKFHVQARLAESGTISASATVNVSNLSKVYRFKSASVRVAAGITATLALKLQGKALKAVRKALRRGKKLTARLTVTATDDAGNRKIERRKVRITL